MSPFNTVLFDLDGTLIDSSAGITRSVAYALKKRGYGEVRLEALRTFIGPPLREEFMKFCGVDADEGAALVGAYREYYTQKGIFECSVYPGIPELLAMLRENGFSLLVATSKPEFFARKIIEHFGLTPYFDFIGGALLDNTRTAKHEVISYTLASAPTIGEARRCVMIGDCTHDVVGAAKLGMSAIAVTYGFGLRSDLEAATPYALCDTPMEVAGILCRG